MESTTQFIDIVKKQQSIYDTTNKDYKSADKKGKAWIKVADEAGLTVEQSKRKWKNLRDSYTKYLRSFRTGAKTSRKYQFWAHATHMDFLRPFQGPGRAHHKICQNDGDLSLESPWSKEESDFGFELLENLVPDADDLNNGKELSALIPTENGYQHHDQQQQQHVNEISHHRHQHQSSVGNATKEHHQNNDSITHHSQSSSSIAVNSTGKKDKYKIRTRDLDATSMFFLSLAKSVRSMPRKYQASIKMRCMKIVSDAEIEIENCNRYQNQFATGGNGPGILDGQQQHQQQHNDENYEHFLYCMSPSRVEAMIDVSSEDETLPGDSFPTPQQDVGNNSKSG